MIQFNEQVPSLLITLVLFFSVLLCRPHFIVQY